MGFKLSEDCRISYGALADDLTLLSGSREDAAGQLGIIGSFCTLHDLKLKGTADGTQSFCNRTAADSDFPTTSHRMSIVPGGELPLTKDKHQSFRVLGAYMNLAGTNKAACKEMKRIVDSWNNILRAKAINHRIAVYLVNSVLFPALLYRSWGNIIAPSTIQKLQASAYRLVKTKCGLSQSTPNCGLWDPNTYGVANLHLLLAKQHLSYWDKALGSYTKQKSYLAVYMREILTAEGYYDADMRDIHWSRGSNQCYLWWISKTAK